METESTRQDQKAGFPCQDEELQEEIVQPDLIEPESTHNKSPDKSDQQSIVDEHLSTDIALPVL